MILIGQYGSSFVRRVGIALTLYGLPFEHRPWSVFGDVEKIRPYNPLVRVPVMVLDGGDVLIESHIIIDHLDSLVPPKRALYPRTEPARHKALRSRHSPPGSLTPRSACSTRCGCTARFPKRWSSAGADRSWAGSQRS